MKLYVALELLQVARIITHIKIISKNLIIFCIFYVFLDYKLFLNKLLILFFIFNRTLIQS